MFDEKCLNAIQTLEQFSGIYFPMWAQNSFYKFEGSKQFFFILLKYRPLFNLIQGLEVQFGAMLILKWCSGAMILYFLVRMNTSDEHPFHDYVRATTKIESHHCSYINLNFLQFFVFRCLQLIHFTDILIKYKIFKKKKK